MSAGVCLSHIGGRSNQEDNFLFYGRVLLPSVQEDMRDGHLVCMEAGMPEDRAHVQVFAVSDGMGGHNAGAAASRVCVEMLADCERNLSQGRPIREIVRIFQRKIAEINKTVCDLSRKHADLRGMGATLAILIICGNQYAVLNIGDSRIYHISDSSITQLTRDHTAGQRLLDLGLLNRKELFSFPARKDLCRYVGVERSGFVLEADVVYPDIQGGVILLCSDGITDSLCDKQILDMIQVAPDLKTAGRCLIERAVENRDTDNTTAILIPVER